MIAEIEGDLRGVNQVKSSKGVFYAYQFEMLDRHGVPFFLRVMSSKNARKPGKQKIKVSISNRRGRAGEVMGGFRIWEVDGEK